MNYTLLITATVSLITGIAGYLLKYFLDRKQAAASASAQYKRDMYQGYVYTVLSFYHNPSPANKQEQAERNKSFADETKEFQKKFVLDATPGVIRAIKKQQMYFKKCNDKGVPVDGHKAQRRNAIIFKAMRRDIGTSNWGLGASAGIIFSPINMYSYEADMHPFWWRIKKQTRKKYWRLAKPISSRWNAIKKKLYDWGAKD